MVRIQSCDLFPPILEDGATVAEKTGQVPRPSLVVQVKSLLIPFTVAGVGLQMDLPATVEVSCRGSKMTQQVYPHAGDESTASTQVDITALAMLPICLEDLFLSLAQSENVVDTDVHISCTLPASSGHLLASTCFPLNQIHLHSPSHHQLRLSGILSGAVDPTAKAAAGQLPSWSPVFEVEVHMLDHRHLRRLTDSSTVSSSLCSDSKSRCYSEGGDAWVEGCMDHDWMSTKHKPQEQMLDKVDDVIVRYFGPLPTVSWMRVGILGMLLLLLPVICILLAVAEEEMELLRWAAPAEMSEDYREPGTVGYIT